MIYFSRMQIPRPASSSLLGFFPGMWAGREYFRGNFSWDVSSDCEGGLFFFVSKGFRAMVASGLVFLEELLY